VALFSRRRNPAIPSAPDPSHWIGRKFRSDCSVDEALANFLLARDECYDVTKELPATWTVPAQAATFVSSQGSATSVPPARLYSWGTSDNRVLTLALWAGMVSHGDGREVAGPPIEMWFVPSGFDLQPIPIAGRWKMQDSSLSSIGWVESPLWGSS